AGTRWARSVPGGMGTRKRAYVNVGLGLDNGSAQWFNEPSTLEGSSAPLGQLVPHLSRLEGDIGAPCTEPAFGVHGFHPQVDGRALGAVLLAVLPFDLKHQGLSVGEAHEVIRDETTARPVPEVLDLETEVVVLGVAVNDARHAL